MLTATTFLVASRAPVLTDTLETVSRAPVNYRKPNIHSRGYGMANNAVCSGKSGFVKQGGLT